MPEQEYAHGLALHDSIEEALEGGARERALVFAACLREGGMRLERGGGYWEGKRYWVVTYQGESVCYVLLSCPEDGALPWTIWSDDSGSDWYANAPADERMKAVAWRYVDACGGCGGCGSFAGTNKTIFGRPFGNVCRTTFRFDNPDAEAVACAMALVAMRKEDILKGRR